MLLEKVGDWGKLGGLLQRLPRRLEVATRKALLKEANFLRKQMVEGIKDQAPAGKKFLPLAVTTLAVRKFKGFNGTKALIKTGELRNSIKVVEAKEGVFIGVHSTTKAKNGRDMVDLATIHEFGAGPFVVPVTPKMRRFLMAAFRKAGLHGPYGKGSGVMVLKIPKRPFVGPVFEKHGGGASRDRIEKELTRLLLGVLAT